jgi:hypothetical protein
MVAIRPWHIAVLLCCTLSVTAIVAAVAAIVVAQRKKN